MWELMVIIVRTPFALVGLVLWSIFGLVLAGAIIGRIALLFLFYPFRVLGALFDNDKSSLTTKFAADLASEVNEMSSAFVDARRTLRWWLTPNASGND